MRNRHPATTDVDVDARHARPERQLAPVVPNPDEPHAGPAGRPEKPAPIFPTEADEAEAIAEVIAADPTLEHASHHLVARAVAAQLRANASRASRRQRALQTAAADNAAPVFPSELHVLDLHEAIPTISAQEVRDVLHAGYGAYLASIDAREPVLAAPEEATP